MRTKRGHEYSADQIVANVTPWALTQLLGHEAPAHLQNKINKLSSTWGAFTVYLGVERAKLPSDLTGHHQIIADHTRPLGETNSVFVSISDADDRTRAPAGKLALTLSTHTQIEPWWQLRRSNSESAYLEKRERYMENMLAVAEQAIPGLKGAISLKKPGTPITFQYFTQRPGGMVGGFPQNSLFKSLGPKTAVPNLWLVGDSIFPGQSTAGVTLGGMRVASAVLQQKQNRLFVLNKWRTSHHLNESRLSKDSEFAGLRAK